MNIYRYYFAGVDWLLQNLLSLHIMDFNFGKICDFACDMYNILCRIWINTDFLFIKNRTTHRLSTEIRIHQTTISRAIFFIGFEQSTLSDENFWIRITTALFYRIISILCRKNSPAPISAIKTIVARIQNRTTIIG